VWFALPNYAATPSKPTVAELNAAANVTSSVAWENFSFGAQASNQISDPALIDVGNTQTRGFAQFGGTISFFYPQNYTDSSNVHLSTFNALSTPLTLGYIIVRSDGQKTTSSAPDATKVAVANDFVSIYKVISDGWADVNTGENSFKYTITFKPQSDLWVNATVATAVTVVTPAAIGTVDYAHPGKTPLGTYITGRQLAAVSNIVSGYPGRFTWTSSDTTKGTIDQNGVFTTVAAGATNIVATDPISGISSTALAITVT
jgi:Bacterial Ig-like domain (group 2)